MLIPRGLLKKAENQTRNFFKMLVHCDKFSAGFHCLRGNPYVICGNRSSRSSQKSGNSGVSISRNIGNLDCINRLVRKELMEFQHVLIKARSIPESEHQLSGYNGRYQYRVCHCKIINNFSMS